MRVIIAGNLVNTGYYIAKLLRTKGIDAELLMKKNDLLINDPKTFDNIIEYPDWVRFWDGTREDWAFRIIKIMRKYDIIHASTELPIFSLFTGKPYLAMATGADLYELAHENSLKGVLLRQAYKKARVVVFTGTFMNPSINKLRIRNALFIPLLWDYTKFSPNRNITNDSEKTIIFHPTNQDWNDKGNDKFLRAFVRLTKKFDNVHLILIKRGRDFESSMKILNNNYSQGKFTILPQTLAQKDLSEWYNKVDIVVDQFIVGSIGLIGQEAMACEKPVINYIDKELHEKWYGEIPPIINAHTEDEIYYSLLQLVNDRNMIRKIGAESRKWLLKHHNPDLIIRKYISIYNAIQNNAKFQTIEDELSSIH